MKMYWGAEVYLHTFLISALDGSEWWASRPGRLKKRWYGNFLENEHVEVPDGDGKKYEASI
jgi:hypothetical protein